MLAKPTRREGIEVSRGLSAKIGLIVAPVLVFLPVAALAQVNIDAGKSAAEIYASDCATCHKTPRGLAAGKNSVMLLSFLREHYTASGAQASALAAYVLATGGAEPAPKQRPETEHARAQEPRSTDSKSTDSKSTDSKSTDSKSTDSKSTDSKSGQPKTAEAKTEQSKTAVHAIRAGEKPEEKRAEEKRAEEKRGKDEAARQEQHPVPTATEDHAPETATREASRAPEEAAPVAREPAPATAVPVPQAVSRETPATAVGPSAPSGPSTTTAGAVKVTRSGLPSLELGSSLDAKPLAEDRPRADVAVPRDNIPD